MTQYDFPGNVCELENIIERAVLFEGFSIAFAIHYLIPDLTKILPYEEVERQILAYALKVMDKNVTQTAQAVKMARSILYRILKLYQLIVSD